MSVIAALLCMVLVQFTTLTIQLNKWIFWLSRDDLIFAIRKGWLWYLKLNLRFHLIKSAYYACLVWSGLEMHMQTL